MCALCGLYVRCSLYVCIAVCATCMRCMRDVCYVCAAWVHRRMRHMYALDAPCTHCRRLWMRCMRRMRRVYALYAPYVCAVCAVCVSCVRRRRALYAPCARAVCAHAYRVKMRTKRLFFPPRPPPPPPPLPLPHFLSWWTLLLRFCALPARRPVSWSRKAVRRDVPWGASRNLKGATLGSLIVVSVLRCLGHNLSRCGAVLRWGARSVCLSVLSLCLSYVSGTFLLFTVTICYLSCLFCLFSISLSLNPSLSQLSLISRRI